ncbi:TIGR03757 family integrating conjugative element protein [Pseudomonas capsici]|uniref:TIGR03757 family integrating conjugative element protein n=1 Tax=Pseudomonas capsici TaxID=2810614 RepID=UPI001F07BDA9|nr:TIGR03757 family integrating conjugative element protein [Pseudomonas capsici]MCV4286467.1 TIGR03757 family integrating conjugative element protein [Pseudomonas capsici]
MATSLRPLPPIISMLCSLTLHAETIVFTDSKHPIQPAHDSKVILLDHPATLEANLSAGLPPDQHQAQAIVQQRITAELATQMTQAHQDVVTAWSLGITKIPAVVVDQKYVVYGEPDVQRALEFIARHREQAAQP